jgi:hypothetical protein
MTSAIGIGFELPSASILDGSHAPSVAELDGGTELAYREGGGIRVTLWWNRVTGELTVSVYERTSGSAFDIHADRRDALEVFNHPYAYARRILDP